MPFRHPAATKPSNQKKQWINAGILLVGIMCFTAGIYHLPEKLFLSNTLFTGGIELFRSPGDLDIYWARQLWRVNGGSLFPENMNEYPLHALPIFVLPGLITQNQEYYRIIFSLVMAIFWWWCALLVSKFLSREKKSHWRIALLILPSFLYFTLMRFDIVPAVLVLTSLWWAGNKKWIAAGAGLGLAIGIKLYAWPTALLTAWYGLKSNPKANKTKRDITHGTFLGIAIITIPILAYVILADTSVLAPYAIQATRAPNIDSIWGIISEYASHAFSARGYLIVRALIKALAWTGPITLLILAARRLSKNNSANLLPAAALMVMGVILFNEFYSPQWVIWWWPLYIIAARTPRHIALGIVHDVFNYFQFPILFNINPWHWTYATIATFRTLLMITLMIILYRELANAVDRQKTQSYQ